MSAALERAFTYWYLHAHTIHIVHPYQPTSSAQQASKHVTILLGGTVQQQIATNSSSNLCRNEHFDSSCHCTTQADGKRPPHQCLQNPWQEFLAWQNRYGTGICWRAIPVFKCLVFSPGRQHEIAISIPSCKGGNLKLIKRHHRTRCPNYHCSKLPIALHDRCCHSPTALAQSPPAPSRMEDMWHIAKHLSSKTHILLIDKTPRTTWDNLPSDFVPSTVWFWIHFLQPAN